MIWVMIMDRICEDACRNTIIGLFYLLTFGET